MTDSLRDKIAAVQRQHRLGRSVVPDHDHGYICECGWRSPEPDCTWTDHPEHVADAVIRELEADRDLLVNQAVRDLQEKYILVPKSQTQQANQPNPSYRPRLVANRDCTPLEWETAE